jgi:hypothetical protein
MPRSYNLCRRSGSSGYAVSIRQPRVLVTSIFAPSPWNRSWYAVQRRYIEKTRDANVRFATYLNGVTSESLGDGVDVAGSSTTNDGHSAALRAVLDIFRKSDHDYFLILDSDCFPIHPDWLNVLTKQMAALRKRFAAPVRVENLDLFPHPSAFFMTSDSVRDSRLDFDLGQVTSNLVGDGVTDVGSAMSGLLPDLLPLLRTNLRNLHPVAAAIYHHLFYHHGAGSRGFRFRVTHRYSYYAHWWDAGRDADLGETLTRQLFAGPEQFIESLTKG